MNFIESFTEYMPYIGYFIVLYYLSVYTNLPKYVIQNTLIFHEFGCQIDDTASDKSENEVDESNQTNESNLTKVEIKFEDKYMTSFKSFSNEYFFTEDELRLKNDKFHELKAEYLANKNKEIDNLNNLILETNKIIELGNTTITDEVKYLLAKYFEIEDDYSENPSNIDFDELYIYVENDHKKFKQEINNLLEEQNKNESNIDTEHQTKALQYVLDKKLDGFINNYILEFTPLGNVYMRYNNLKKSFEYFSNNTIPYRYLESLGRKYVMTFRCKALFIDLEDELKKAAEKEKEKEQKTLEKETSIPLQKFKNYNKDIKMDKSMARPSQNNLPLQMKVNLPNVNTSSENQLLKENANRYTWEGRLSNLSLLKKIDRKIVDKNYTMSFADFKQMSQIKR
jgi:hypothetical protein